MEQARAAAELKKILDAFLEAKKSLWPAAVDAVTAALGKGGKIVLFGNGGSAAEAQHFAAELINRFMKNRRAMPALALTTDTSSLTAIANDAAFEQVFSRQVEALGRPGDVAIGLTTSGGSANVIEGLKAARAKGMTTVALTGEGGLQSGAPADFLLDVASRSTPRIQEAHLFLLHLLAEEIEKRLT